jgi:hypothetical protein
MTKTEVAHEERSEEPHILAMRGWKAVPVAEAVCVMAIEKESDRTMEYRRWLLCGTACVEYEEGTTYRLADPVL